MIATIISDLKYQTTTVDPATKNLQKTYKDYLAAQCRQQNSSCICTSTNQRIYMALGQN